MAKPSFGLAKLCLEFGSKLSILVMVGYVVLFCLLFYMHLLWHLRFLFLLLNWYFGVFLLLYLLCIHSLYSVTFYGALLFVFKVLFLSC